MTKLCPRGKAAAKRKFSVYPSAYANAYASKVCAGKIKDDKGTKRKDFKGPKPSGGGGTGAAARKIRKAGLGMMMLAGKKNRRKVRDEMKDNNLQMVSPGLYAMSSLSEGGTPESTGSYLKQDIDGESFTNPSAQDYYKGMID